MLNNLIFLLSTFIDLILILFLFRQFLEEKNCEDSRQKFQDPNKNAGKHINRFQQKENLLKTTLRRFI